MISDCHGAPVVPQGCPIGTFKRGEKFFRNDGKYCAECAMPCIPVCDFVAVSNSPEISTESVIVTEGIYVHTPGFKLHLPVKTAIELWLDTEDGKLLIEALKNSMVEAIAKLTPAGVQYSYDTDTKKVLAS